MLDMRKMEEVAKLLSFALYQRGSHLTGEDISQTVEQFRSVWRLVDEEVDYLIRRLESEFVTTMGVGVPLTDREISHDDEWFLGREAEWPYWKDYESYLIAQGWPLRVVQSLDTVTDNILGLLNDPLDEGEWERKGLVIGHVQSGKTANYIGLISKAADAGYKFIIVIAGIHNSLRTQTQERVDEGFIGRDSRSRESIGVGKIRPKRSVPITVTTTDSDFNRTLARRFNVELNSLNNTFILVVKKNASTLGSLHTWLRDLNTRQGLEKISDIPMLLIDDEADNASINTNKPDLQPTRINREIRGILSLFRKRCYVGYTATPFANVFIDPDESDEKLGSDLFPEHFIYSLDAPSNYFGAEKVFIDDEAGHKFIRYIEDAENWIPLNHKKDDPIDGLPDTLKKAIRVFVLCRAIRNLRGQNNAHCSMLVNVSRFVTAQREIRQLVRIYVEQLIKAIRFNYRLSVEQAQRDLLYNHLVRDFDKEYVNTGVTWEEVKSELNNAAASIRVILVNSKSDEALLYKEYSRDGNALTPIVVGGLSLSRGLTIEGLAISYIYRNSAMYDTLMQMGRWFGYRNGYEDLCRVYMSEVSHGWYSHIAEATEELRMQVKRMRREQKKPSDFGLYVRAHPDSLIVTAANKMRDTATRALQVSYDGKLLETHIVPASDAKNVHNGELIKSLFANLRTQCEPRQDDTTSLLFTGIDWRTVRDFVSDFRYHDMMFDLSDNTAEYIRKIADLYPAWDISFKSIINSSPVEGYTIAAQERTVGKASQGEYGWHVGNKQRFSGNSMFKIGLDQPQLVQADQIAREAERKSPIYSDYTDARGKPILLVHLLHLMSDARSEQRDIIVEAVPALSISFPHSSEFRTVDYIVNQVWLKNFEEAVNTPADEDEDDL